jgi:hypothetical protein
MLRKLNVFSLYVCLGIGALVAQTTPTNAPQEGPPAEKPRVFITDSQSWETSGSAGGAGGAFGAESHGGARPQTAEIIKTFGEKCPGTVINNLQAKANYIVLLDHEGGKGLLRHRNKVAVFEAHSGDAVVSKSTLSLGGSVDEACRGIMQHWATYRPATRADAAPPQSTGPAPASSADPKPAGAKLNVASTPDGADIEVDGNFMGNTPSVLEVTPGDHTVSIKKTGFKSWDRKLKVSGGEVNVRAELTKDN